MPMPSFGCETLGSAVQKIVFADVSKQRLGRCGNVGAKSTTAIMGSVSSLQRGSTKQRMVYPTEEIRLALLLNNCSRRLTVTTSHGGAQFQGATLA